MTDIPKRVECPECGAPMTGYASTGKDLAYTACSATFGTHSHQFLIRDLRRERDLALNKIANWEPWMARLGKHLV